MPSMPSSISPTPKPKNQLRGCRRVSTIAEIFSVTLAKVCPGAMTGGGA